MHMKILITSSVPVSNRHNARSRTSSTGSLVGGVGGLNQAGQAGAEPHLFNRGVRCPSIEQLSASSRASSIPPTPAPTPNPLLQVINTRQILDKLASSGPYGPFLAIQRAFIIRY